MLIPTWGCNDVCTLSKMSVSVGTRGSPALSRTLESCVPQTGRKGGARGGTSWSYEEIHGKSAIGKSNFLARKNLVVGKWEPVHTQQLMWRILTTIWNKHFEFAFKVKLGETANNKKQCRDKEGLRVDILNTNRANKCKWSSVQISTELWDWKQRMKRRNYLLRGNQLHCNGQEWDLGNYCRRNP